MIKILSIVFVVLLAVPLAADYSSLTQEELVKVKTALDMAAEYKSLLDKHEVRKVESITKVSDNEYIVTLLLTVILDGKPTRDIRRTIPLTITAESPSVWPWCVASGAAGLIIGFLLAK